MNQLGVCAMDMLGQLMQGMGLMETFEDKKECIWRNVEKELEKLEGQEDFQNSYDAAPSKGC